MKNRWLNSFTIAGLATALSLFIYYLNFDYIGLLELKAYDFKVTARGERPVSDQVVIVAIDEKSLKKEGRWPWPRSRLARLIDSLTQSEVSAIGVDILFPEKDIYIPLAEVKEEISRGRFQNLDSRAMIRLLDEVGDSDSRFTEALAKSSRTVLGYFVFSSREQTQGIFPEISQRELDILDFSQYSMVQMADANEVSAPMRSIYAVGLSLPELMNAANSNGYLSFVPEQDGVVRRLPMIQAHKEYIFPPFSLQVLKQGTRMQTTVRLSKNRVEEILLGNIMIPVTERGDFLINYYGPTGTFKYISATDVISGNVPKEDLKGKIVLIGATATATHDLHTTSYGPLNPGVEIHATVIENIINGDYLQRPAWIPMLDISITIAVGLLLGLIGLYFKAIATALLLLVGIGGYMTTDYLLFSRYGLSVNSIYPVFIQIFVYFSITLYSYIFEEKEKRFIKEAFSQYLAPAVVDRLVDDPKLLKLGGERKVLTAFFSDVADFSTIAEELVDLLNDYLTDMTEIILKYEGTVDKYEGDAIIAFFGAPITLEDHASRTCLAAIDMQKRLAELREVWKKEDLPELFMRIGINTGQMVVGNMGSTNRMDYTMMGDSVNLAARLEGANKQYQTYTMLSEFTYELAKNDIEARELDSVRVVGKKEPIRIYELLGRKGEMEDYIRLILPHFREGLDHYKNQRWEEGITCFENALNLHEDDGPSLTYFERCITFQNHPPPLDWDGVFSMRTK